MRTLGEILAAVERTKEVWINDSHFVNDTEYNAEIEAYCALLKSMLTSSYHTFIDKVNPLLENERRFIDFCAIINDIIDDLFTEVR